MRYEPKSDDLSHILRALPTIVQIVYYARELDMPRAKAELEQYFAEEKMNMHVVFKKEDLFKKQAW